MDASTYSATEMLRGGRAAQIRALRPDDEEDFLGAVERVGAQSLYRRFFTAKRSFSDREKAFFVNVDFVKHVALVAVVDECGRSMIVGGGRYIVLEPGKAEMAFVVVDAYQGKGIGKALVRHLAVIARKSGIVELIAEVLPENVPMLKAFQQSGLAVGTKRETQIVHVTARLV